MIEIPEMLTLIEIAVSERGENFRYEDYAEDDLDVEIEPNACLYRHPVTGKPLCIAGVVLAEAGLIDLVREGDIVAGQSHLVGKVSSYALDVLNAAQAAQDSGETWGAALTQARERAEELES